MLLAKVKLVLSGKLPTTIRDAVFLVIIAFPQLH
jgi:hypothetical protein